ncbi:WAT1-related protein [Tanacetum coccineum]
MAICCIHLWSDVIHLFIATIHGPPVTNRLLDPPLHLFLPEGDLEQIVGELTRYTCMTEEEIYSGIEKLSEVNPMLGHAAFLCLFSHTPALSSHRKGLESLVSRDLDFVLGKDGAKQEWEIVAKSTKRQSPRPAAERGQTHSFSENLGLSGMDIISKVALNEGMSNYVFVVYRHAVATVVMAPFAIVLDKNIRPKMTKPIFIKLMLLALLEPVIDQNLYFQGMKATTATFAVSMCNVLPAITFVMAFILR